MSEQDDVTKIEGQLRHSVEMRGDLEVLANKLMDDIEKQKEVERKLRERLVFYRIALKMAEIVLNTDRTETTIALDAVQAALRQK